MADNRPWRLYFVSPGHLPEWVVSTLGQLESGALPAVQPNKTNKPACEELLL